MTAGANNGPQISLVWLEQIRLAELKLRNFTLKSMLMASLFKMESSGNISTC